MVKIAKCKKCGAKLGGGFFSFKSTKESNVSGLCVNCVEEGRKKKTKRKKDKMRKAWLYKR